MPGVLRWFRTKRELIKEIKLLERVYRRAWTDRKRKVFARRVREAIEAGFEPEIIIAALGVVYLGREVISQAAWDTALDMATRKNAAVSDYRLTDTQRSILGEQGLGR